HRRERSLLLHPLKPTTLHLWEGLLFFSNVLCLPSRFLPGGGLSSLGGSAVVFGCN
ncbi:hypothetical protein AALP_AA4G102400, partial [Arabis alpina]